MEALAWFAGALTLGAWTVSGFEVGSEAAGSAPTGTKAGRFATFPPVLGALCCPDFPCPSVDESATAVRAPLSPEAASTALLGWIPLDSKVSEFSVAAGDGCEFVAGCAAGTADAEYDGGMVGLADSASFPCCQLVLMVGTGE